VAEPPPAIQPVYKALLRFSPDPNGPPPSIDDAALAREINYQIQAAKTRGTSVDVGQIDAQRKAFAAEGLSAYTALWTRWATGERPRRRTIALYGDLFALLHQMEAEQTSKPQELIWGIGISSWHLKTEKGAVSFEYPLLTQAMELIIDDRSMAIEIRPRATETLLQNGRQAGDRGMVSRGRGERRSDAARLQHCSQHDPVRHSPGAGHGRSRTGWDALGPGRLRLGRSGSEARHLQCPL